MSKKYKQQLLDDIKENIGSYLVTNFTVLERNALFRIIERECEKNEIEIKINVVSDNNFERYFDRKDYE